MSEPGRDIAAILRDGAAIDRAFDLARLDVVRRPRQLGVPLVVWQDGRVTELSPWSVPLPEDDPATIDLS